MGGHFFFSLLPSGRTYERHQAGNLRPAFNNTEETGHSPCIPAVVRRLWGHLELHALFYRRSLLLGVGLRRAMAFGAMSSVNG